MEMLGRPATLHVNGVDLAYGEMGKGPPLVLLHGLGDTHRTWRRVADDLARSHRVLMPDLPGHGWSGRPIDAPYTARWYGDTIAEWMRAIGVDRASICGHSFGGGIALTMTRDHHDLVDRLALVAPGGLGREVCFWLRVSALPIGRSFLGSLALRRIALRLAVTMGPARFARPEPDELERYHVLAAQPGSAIALHRTLEACMDLNGQRISFWDDAPTIKRLPPIALFWGDTDPVVPVTHADAAMKRLRHASLHRYAQVGHFPHLDEPERFTDDLLEFLGDAERPCCKLADVSAPLASAARKAAAMLELGDAGELASARSAA
jgi:pimeloyl-ACP methyl ester carboxylesterase